MECTQLASFSVSEVYFGLWEHFIWHWFHTHTPHFPYSGPNRFLTITNNVHNLILPPPHCWEGAWVGWEWRSSCITVNEDETLDEFIPSNVGLMFHRWECYSSVPVFHLSATRLYVTVQPELLLGTGCLNLEGVSPWFPIWGPAFLPGSHRYHLNATSPLQNSG